MTKRFEYAAASAEPIEVVIEGEAFAFIPAMPWTTVHKHLSTLSDIRPFVSNDGAEEFWAFWNDAMVDDAEYERFRKYVDDPTRRVNAALLTRIANDLLAEYTGLPLGQRTSSPPSSTPTPDTSKARSRSKASSSKA